MNECYLMLLVHAGGLLSGSQLRGRRAAAAHERGAGLRHAQVPHV